MTYYMGKSSWSILTVTEGGTVSLLKALSEHDARQTMQRLDRWGNPWKDPEASGIREAKWEEKRRKSFSPMGNIAISEGGSYLLSSATIRKIECWNEKGDEMVVWPKPDDYDARKKAAYEAEMARLGLLLDLAS